MHNLQKRIADEIASTFEAGIDDMSFDVHNTTEPNGVGVENNVIWVNIGEQEYKITVQQAYHRPDTEVLKGMQNLKNYQGLFGSHTRIYGDK